MYSVQYSSPVDQAHYGHSLIQLISTGTNGALSGIRTVYFILLPFPLIIVQYSKSF